MHLHRIWQLAPASTLLCLLLAGGQPLAAQDARFQDEIEVRRIITELRVIDQGGRPVPGIEADDLEVMVGGVPAEVESMQWIAAPAAASTSAELTGQPGSSEISLPTTTEQRTGRLLVFVFQSDLQFAPVRVSGLIRMSYHARQLLDDLSAEDRVAVAIFGSHLELHCDLTNDFGLVHELLGVPALLESYQSTEQRSSPSLVPGFDVDAAWKAASMSAALAVIGNALEPIPGPKSIVLFGWGIGRYGSSGVWLGKDYVKARYALAAARASVFSLDITTADYHTLEVGLQAMSEGTGGFYIKTHLFPEQAIIRLARVISGYYELSIIAPAEVKGYQEVEIRVHGHKHFDALTRPVIDVGGRDEPAVGQP